MQANAEGYEVCRVVAVCVQTAWLGQQCGSHSAITGCAATHAAFTSRSGTLEIPRGSPVVYAISWPAACIHAIRLMPIRLMPFVPAMDFSSKRLAESELRGEAARKTRRTRQLESWSAWWGK